MRIDCKTVAIKKRKYINNKNNIGNETMMMARTTMVSITRIIYEQQSQGQ